ncbi:SCO family protein [Endozoicomonas lisbonensis]|uniref:Protein SCO1/2 n=1 Tax=Endozoicomonas lisbonensis TaxID=3120522 RepID=A0ABV2SHI4_9GAMM
MKKQIKGNVSTTVLLLLAVVAMVLGLTFYKYTTRPSISLEDLQKMGTVVFDTPRSFQMADLTDHNGKTYNSGSQQGQWTLMYFGYTFCPDICPITLSQLNGMDKQLKQDNINLAQQMRYVLVSVDPRRDTVEKLKGYVPYFNKDFIGVTGEVKNIHDLTVQLNIPYTPVLDPEDEFYLVDHGANLAIINPAGQYHGFIRPPLEPAKLTRIMTAVDENYRR